MYLLELFAKNPIIIIPWAFSIVFALTIHEYAHGLAAKLLGDDTAEKAGRLTLNPLAHLDPIGSLLLLFVGFGWAKPVPINIYSIGKGRLGVIIVSFAGVLFNLLFGIFSILLLKYFIIGVYPADSLLVIFLGFLIFINFALFIFNLIPIPPLDGYHIIEYLFPNFILKHSFFIQRWGFLIIVVLVMGTPVIGYIISLFILFMSYAFQFNIFAVLY